MPTRAFATAVAAAANARRCERALANAAHRRAAAAACRRPTSDRRSIRVDRRIGARCLICFFQSAYIFFVALLCLPLSCSFFIAYFHY